jgi:tRNA-2-methylthio-N6-dimethylallyladenosine synthase
MSDLRHLRYHVATFGCQMNENDSEHIAGLLGAAGAAKVERVEDADLAVVNTCAVREKSEEKLYSYLGRLRALKKKRGLLIAVAGCVAQTRGEKLLRINPAIDIILGPDNYHRLPAILAGLGSETHIWTGRVRKWPKDDLRPVLRESPLSAYVTIMEGCDRFSAYCIVPFARGREKCRPLENILVEVRGLARAGYREIKFLGQNVNAYKDPATGARFDALLQAADGIDGIAWIRFITSHPGNFGPEIAEAMTGAKRVCRQLHLPLQSGSTPVLERMRRGYSRDDFLEKVGLLRGLMPELALSTDIIVGFPGETEAEFAETLDVLESVRFAGIFSFCYSPRPRTAAALYDDDVPLEVKKRRLTEVQQAQKRIQTEIHQTFIGKTIRVLCAGTSKKDLGILSGRSEGNQVVNFAAPNDALGRFVQVRITGCGPFSLRGECVEIA